MAKKDSAVMEPPVKHHQEPAKHHGSHAHEVAQEES